MMALTMAMLFLGGLMLVLGVLHSLSSVTGQSVRLEREKGALFILLGLALFLAGWILAGLRVGVVS